MPSQIKAEPLDREAWSSYGWIPVRDTDPEDGGSRLVFEWSDVHLNIISHRLDELVQTDTGLVCDVMFRRLTHTQALLVLNCPAVVAVAPPSCQLSGTADLTRYVLFSSVLWTLSFCIGDLALGPVPGERPTS